MSVTDLTTAKLVLAGPVGAGKSTAIRAIADGEPVSTDVPLSQGATEGKTTTTVALDFATVSLDDGTPLFLYGLPGQDHFSFMRPILLQGAIGVIVLLNGSDPNVTDQCEDWLRSIHSINAGIGIGIGITHMDQAPGFSMKRMREAIHRCGAPLPVFTLDARDRAQTAHLVRAMLLSIA
jgi:uncharacterized protein